MKKFISIFMAFAVAVCFIAPANLAVVNADENKEENAKKGEDVSILFTHDMHSHMDSKEIILDGKKEEIGGFARIKTVKEEIEKKYPDTLLVDAGDFSMGTAFQTIYKTQAPELVTMGKMGYDAVTLGNHEFDYKVQGLADMLNAASSQVKDKEQLAKVTGLNIDWNKTFKDKETTKAGHKLKKAFDEYGVEDYTIVEKNGVKIAVFGLIGNDAIAAAPEAKLHFSDYIERAEQIVDEIKKNGEADMIVCLSHSGTGNTEADFDDSEDVKLAKSVKGIDLIVSGHSHGTLEEPKKVGDTVIVSCGEYNYNVGHIVFEKNGKDGFKVKDYQLIELNDSVKKDGEIQGIVDGYRSDIDDGYFNKYGYKYNQVLAENDIEFTPITEFGEEQKDDRLGNLIADSYVYTVNKMEKGKKDADPVDVAVIPAGSVRDSLIPGDVTVSDVFNISSLGVGPDGTVGYPVVSVYLTGKELKHIAEVDATVSDKMKIVRLYTSGLNYTINSHRLPMNRATDVKLADKNGKEIEKLDNNKLYRVVGGLYTCQRLSLVNEQSHGFLSIELKDKDGNVIKDINKAVVKDKDGNELKEWQVLAEYIDSFKGDKIPKYYEKDHNRKVVDNSYNPIKLFKQPNHIAVMVCAIALIPIVIIAGIIISIVRNKHRRRGYKKSIFSGSKNKNYSKVMSSRSRGIRPAKHTMNMSKKNKRGRKSRF